MRNYEVAFIVHPDLEEIAFNEIVERVRVWINESGGGIIQEDIWGKRKLAYPIDKLLEGQYVFFQTQMPPTYCDTLERQIGLQEPIIRFMITAQEE